MDSKFFGQRIYRIASKQKAFLAIVLMFVFMLFSGTNFYTKYNLIELLRSASILAILGFGVTITIICGGCDLSIGGIMCFSGISTIMLMDYMPMWLAIILAILLGALVGFINGFFVVHQKTEPFIITLGMGMLLKGVCQQMTNAVPISSSNLNFMKIANGRMLGSIPNLIIIMLIVFTVLHILMRYTQYGRNCYAIGGDYDVAEHSGIDTIRIKWIAFIISGATAGLGGIMLSSKLNSGSSVFGDTTALIVNCGVVVGGTSFAGGIGGIPQSAIGILVFSVLENCLNMLRVGGYIQQALKGLVILAIICLDCYSRKRKREDV